MSTINIPNTCYCPITLQLMTDPVMGPDRQTYERVAIERWLDIHSKSPITKQPMAKSQLVPNIALRDVIEGFRNVQSVLIPVSEPVPQYDEQSHLISYVNKFDDESSIVHLKIVPPVEGQRKPSVLICGIDVSGSMDTEVKNGDEDNGFSRLDLVKHALRTMISMLRDNDYLSIITFSDSAKIVFPLTQMNEVGRGTANLTVESLRTEGCTNIWDCLNKIMDVMKHPICKDRNVHSVLLTDGCPNRDPPRGIIPTLERHLQSNVLKGTISTFGFGYELDSKLLDDIATKTFGGYNFIPDATMVGTIFVNFISNCLSSMYDRLSVQIETNCEILEKYGSTEFGIFEYGQPRDVIFRIKNKENNTFKVKFENQEINVDLTLSNVEIHNETGLQITRLRLINDLYSAVWQINNIDSAQSTITRIYQNLKVYETDTRIAEIIKDFISSDKNHAQITKAFSQSKWFNKWGRHYILSYIKAHLNQQCNNFKDPGVQIYGGKLFEKLRDEADIIFCNLPPPKPSRVPYTLQQQSSYVATQTMATYHDPTGGCFGGNCIVRMYDGLLKSVKDINKGDIVFGGAKILCVVKTKVSHNEKQMVEINGLQITNWHPIRIKGDWVFPTSIVAPKTVNIDYVYNFVLDMLHIMVINNIECCTLGHGMTNNNVIKHEYFGTNKIINDLRKMKGWNDGLVELTDDMFIRNDKHVIGYQI